MAGAAGFEPAPGSLEVPTLVLKTSVLPLHYAPKKGLSPHGMLRLDRYSQWHCIIVAFPEGRDAGNSLSPFLFIRTPLIKLVS